MCDAPKDMIGRVATSRAGRDRGRAFLIVDVLDGEFVFIADGCLRKLERPKKKKCKHLHFEPATALNIRTKLLEGKQVFDAEIRNCLLNLGYNVEER